jgi:hypothetical protein
MKEQIQKVRLKDILYTVIGLWVVKQGSEVVLSSANCLETTICSYEKYRNYFVTQIISSDETTHIYIRADGKKIKK